MRFLKYLLVVAVTAAVTLGCVYAFSRVSCGAAEEDARASPVTVLSATYTYAEEDSEDGELPEGYKTDVSRGTRAAFDVIVIALTIGLIVLVWLLIRRVMKRNGGTGRRFR